MTAFDVLKGAYGDEIARHVCDAYKEVESHHALGKWKTSELDAGHFVEAVRRLLQKQFTGAYTPFNEELSKFNDQALLYYQNQAGHESYRLLIPQSLKAIYSIRNKRGVGHVGEVSPNRMDSTFLLHATKWVLAEVVRLNSKASIDETEKIVTAIAERRVDGLWKEGKTKRLLNTAWKASEQVLVLLYDESPTKVETLQGHIEYRNPSEFKKKILRPLHTGRFIEWGSSDDCVLLPAGLRKAEELLLDQGTSAGNSAKPKKRR